MPHTNFGFGDPRWYDTHDNGDGPQSSSSGKGLNGDVGFTTWALDRGRVPGPMPGLL